MDVKSGWFFIYQSGRAGDETKKRKSLAKSGRVGITASEFTMNIYSKTALFISDMHNILKATLSMIPANRNDTHLDTFLCCQVNFGQFLSWQLKSSTPSEITSGPWSHGHTKTLEFLGCIYKPEVIETPIQHFRFPVDFQPSAISALLMKVLCGYILGDAIEWFRAWQASLQFNRPHCQVAKEVSV